MSEKKSPLPGLGGKAPWWTPEGQSRAPSSPSKNLPPGFVHVRPIETEGSRRLEAREGGTEPLWVHEQQPGIYTSVWMIQNKAALKMIKEQKCAMTIVIDTNVPGHPSVSVGLQPINLIEG